MAGCPGLGKQKTKRPVLSQEQHATTERSWQWLFYIHMWIRFPALQSKFLVFFCFALENDYEDILYRFIFTWGNVINKKSAKAPGDGAQCKVGEVTGNTLAHGYWGLSHFSVLL